MTKNPEPQDGLNSQPRQMDLFQMLASALVTIARGEHILQNIREVLVTDPAFTPMSLLKYLGRGHSAVNRKPLLSFLNENSLVVDEKETYDLLGRLFMRYQSSEELRYTAFLSFLYPFNTSILRDVALKAKKYPQLDRLQKNLRPADSVISGFLLLLQEELTLERKVQVQVSDPAFPGSEKLRKIIKSIKKASLRLTSTVTEQSEGHISILEIRNFIKAFIDAPEHLFLGLGRRLGMDKAGKVPIENIEAALKKSKRKGTISKQYRQQLREEDGLSDIQIQEPSRLNHRYVEQRSEDSFDQRKTKETNYRQQLYRELSQTLKIPNQQHPRKKSKTPRGRSNSKPFKDSNRTSLNSKIKNTAFNYPQQQIYMPAALQQEPEVNNNHYINEEARRRKDDVLDYVANQQKTRHRKPSHSDKQSKRVNKVFREYIQTFLNANKEIERCRNKINSIQNIDYLSLFKSLDNGKGVVEAQDLRQFYIRLSGIPIDYDFQLLVDRFSQPDQQWLSYTEFADIFKSASSASKPQTTSLLKTSNCSVSTLKPQLMRLMSQLIYLILDLEQKLQYLKQQLGKPDLQWLFCSINIDSESKGFINYQELKKYVVEELELNASMMDLMSLLKRLDKSKNGVLVKEQFLSL